MKLVVLFDLDGVLIDSFEPWFIAFNQTLDHFGLAKISKEKFRRKFWGPELKINLDRIGLDEDAVRYCQSQYIGLIDKVKLYQNAKKILETVRRTYKTGLVTNTPKEGVSKILSHFRLGSYFDGVVTGDDVSVAKPNPEIVIKACGLLGVDPKDAILVGDTKSDVLAGRGAGCTVVGLNVDADKKIRDLTELLRLLSYEEARRILISSDIIKLQDLSARISEHYGVPVSTMRGYIRKIAHELGLSLAIVREGKVGRPPLYIVRSDMKPLDGFVLGNKIIFQTALS